MTTDTRPNAEHGDREIALGGEILRTTVGSGALGTAVEGTDDHDEMGVYIEPPEVVFGLGGHRERYVWRTQPEGARSGPGDTDLVMYGLRKYMRLAVGGNPTVLLPLFVQDSDVLASTPLGDELRDMRSTFLSLDAVERFLGYMHNMHERMLGRGRQSRVPNRPELVERYGWDTKYGGHALRLAMQAYEIVSKGTLTLPMPEEQRLQVLDVRTGKYTRDEVSALVSMYERTIREVVDEGRSPLPAHPDVDTITTWVASAHLRWWGVA